MTTQCMQFIIMFALQYLYLRIWPNAMLVFTSVSLKMCLAFEANSRGARDPIATVSIPIRSSIGVSVRIAILESRYDMYRDTLLMLRPIDYQAKIKEA